MAGELSGIANMGFTKGSITALQRNLTFTVDVTGTKYHAGVQAIGTSEEALVVGDVGTAGWFWGRNLDATNFIELRMGTGAADMVKMKPGECCFFRLAASTPWAIADTLACELEYVVVED